MSTRKNLIIAAIFCLTSSLVPFGLAVAQIPGGSGAAPGGGPGHDGFGRPPMERAFHDGNFGRWWHNPHLSQALNLTDDQKQKMDDIFQQNKPGLHGLFESLRQQEALLGPMIGADQPNEDQVLAQIDKVAQARADLEKANARMLFDLRKTLTPDQWQKLKALHAEHREQMRQGGPDAWHGHQPGPPPPDGQAPNGPPPAPQNGAPPPQGDAQDGPPPALGDVAPPSLAPQL